MGIPLPLPPLPFPLPAHSFKPSGRSAGIAILALICTLAACMDKARDDGVLPASPRHALTEGAPVVLGTYDLPILGVWNGPLQPLPVQLPTTGRYKLRIRVDGHTSFASNTCVDSNGGPTMLGPYGYRFANGFQSWDVYFRVLDGVYGNYHTIFPRSFASDGSSVTWEITLDRPGTLLWNRAELLYCGQYDPSGVYATSNQKVTVTVIPYVEAQQGELALTCNARPVGPQASVTLTRGEEIACSVASTNPALPPQNIRWSYRDEKNHRIEKAPEEGPPAEWGGRMVSPGQISVTATVGSTEKTVTAVVNVNPRAWRDMLPPAVEDISAPTCAVRTAQCHPHRIVQWQDLGKTVFAPSGPAPTGSLIVSGPNREWTFIDGGPDGAYAIPHPVMKLHPQLFDPTSEFYTGRIGRFCNATEVIAWIRSHELVHVQIGHESAAEGSINPWLENLREYRRDPDRLRERARGRLLERLATFLDAGHTKSNRYPDHPTCLRAFENTN